MGGGYKLKMVKCSPGDSNPRVQRALVIFFKFFDENRARPL